VVAFGVKNLVAERAPIVLERILHAEPALGFSDPLMGRDNLVCVGSHLPELLSARKAFRPEGGSVHGAGVRKPFVVPSLVKEVGQSFLLASGKMGHGSLSVSRELGVKGGKASVTVRARVVAAKDEAMKQRVGHFRGVADGSEESSLSVSGSAAEAKASKVEAAARLCPLLVVRGQTRKGSESSLDFLVEVLKRPTLQVRGDGAHAVGEFANASASSQKASSDLRVVELG